MRFLAFVVALIFWNQRTIRMAPFDWMKDKTGPPQSPDIYYEVRLTILQRELVLEAIKRFTTTSGTLKKNAVQALELAIPMPGPVKPLIDFDAAELELEKRNAQAPGRWSLADLAEEE